ncbi:MAG: glycosyltransferase family 2 protein [Lachnospiraceae bacterium]|nr:glycosyltransferase family 2 protein [Lachnospiraceae bacterium]
MKNAYIIIPALDPEEKLIPYIKELISAGFGDILIVDDGSSPDHKYVFDDIKQMNECTVITHSRNLGKGRALKNAFDHFLKLPTVSEFEGVICVDCDGQHSVADVCKIYDELCTGREELILGSRDFSLGNTPKKSMAGNKTVRLLFKLLCRLSLNDTQTGLRGIPTSILPEFKNLSGDRYEYEMNMLILSANKHIPVIEIPIETIYINDNKGSHYRPFADSVRIAALIFKALFRR